jgi:hypothetical protein
LRYAKKFAAGKKHIPALFPGIDLPKELEQVALFVYGGRGEKHDLADAKGIFIRDFLLDILAAVRQRRMAAAAVPEEYPLLSTLQFSAQFWPVQGRDAG